MATDEVRGILDKLEKLNDKYNKKKTRALGIIEEEDESKQVEELKDEV